LRKLGAVLTVVSTLAPCLALAQRSALPKVEGPIPATAPLGDQSHDYPYGSTAHWVGAFGYREDEFFVSGKAIVYKGDGYALATADTASHAYKTRVMVRRPLDARRFNGTVILEFITTSGQQDQENEWIWTHEHLMRSGYVHVGVSAQARGVNAVPNGLRSWSPRRYGTLDVNRDGTGPVADDIFAQVAATLKDPAGSALLGGLRARNVIASGHSSSALALSLFYNGVQQLTRVIDGFVLHGFDVQLRPEVETPAVKLLAELDGETAAVTEFIRSRGLPPGVSASTYSDTQFVRVWQVAGWAHAGRDLMDPLRKLFARDFTDRGPVSKCEQPPPSEVPGHFVQEALYDAMKRWIEQGVAPPHAPRIQHDGTPPQIVRDRYGIAVGGIRLPQVAVPVAMNSGVNSREQSCRIFGAHVPFADSTLVRLYPTHTAYVTAVERAADDAARAGYITQDAAARIVAEAERSNVRRP
jgi:hypothetical protein